MNITSNTIYSNKSTASRELGKLGVPKEDRAQLIKGEFAPFTIDVKLLKKVINAIKSGETEKVEKPAQEELFYTQAELNEMELIANASSEETAKPFVNVKPVAEKPKRATKEELDHLFGKTESTPAKRVQNGKTYPMRGVCKAIWDEASKFYATFNQIPTPAQMQEIGIANNWHKVTVYRQFNEWKRFNGFL